MHDLIWLRHFLFLATWPNKLTMTLIHWQPLELKPLFLVLSILLNLKKKKTMFVLTLGRKKELVDYVEIGWGIKCGGEYFPHKVIKMAKRKIIVDDRVLKWKMIVVWKKKEQQRIKEKKKGIVFETMLHNFFFLSISKTHKS